MHNQTTDRREDAELNRWLNASPSGATSKDGHAWSGEVFREGTDLLFLYTDENGSLYESKEQPAFRIAMDKAAFVRGVGIMPLSAAINL